MIECQRVRVATRGDANRVISIGSGSTVTQPINRSTDQPIAGAVHRAVARCALLASADWNVTYCVMADSAERIG